MAIVAVPDWKRNGACREHQGTALSGAKVHAGVGSGQFTGWVRDIELHSESSRRRIDCFGLVA